MFLKRSQILKMFATKLILEYEHLTMLLGVINWSHNISVKHEAIKLGRTKE